MLRKLFGSVDPSKSSSDCFMGIHTIIHDGAEYMTRFWFWRFRMHIFHHGDHDKDFHDHPWNFWTLPITTGYVEEILKPDHAHTILDANPKPQIFYKQTVVVKPFRIYRRRAEHAHRVLGAWNGKIFPSRCHEQMIDRNKKIVTLVYQGGARRKWGFWKRRANKWCWEYWEKYVLQGGRDAPCS